MKLFYGSKTNFTKPIYGFGNPSNDYGLGFYMTDSYDLAKLWASQFNEDGYVLSFDLDLSNLNVLSLKDCDEINVLRWISLLIRHRFSFEDLEKYSKELDWLNTKFYVDLNNYDVVIGYRADDAYFNYSRSFVANEMSFEILTKAMRIGKLGLQYVAISKKAYKSLKFIKSEKISKNSSYSDFRKCAVNEYNIIKKEDKISNMYFRDLVRKYGE